MLLPCPSQHARESGFSRFFAVSIRVARGDSAKKTEDCTPNHCKWRNKKFLSQFDLLETKPFSCSKKSRKSGLLPADCESDSPGSDDLPRKDLQQKYRRGRSLEIRYSISRSCNDQTDQKIYILYMIYINIYKIDFIDTYVFNVQNMIPSSYY